MDNSNNNIDNQSLLNTPIAYVLQTKTIEELENSFDSNGWNILHHAIADFNLPKIRELMHFSFNWKINSKANYIPPEIYSFADTKKTPNFKTPSKIPFCQNGFTPLHLAMFLFNYYHGLDGNYHYQKIGQNYSEAIAFFIEKNGDLESYVDADGLSLFDYAFLLEDAKLIEKFQMADPGFASLKKVSPKIAKQILEVMEIKHQSKCNHLIIEALEKKILNDSLSANLKVNQTTKKTTQKV